MQPNFEQPEFPKQLFPGYTGIPIPSPTNSRKLYGEKFFAAEIHRESHPVSTRILVMYHTNRKIAMIFPLVSCCSSVNNPSSS